MGTWSTCCAAPWLPGEAWVGCRGGPLPGLRVGQLQTLSLVYFCPWQVGLALPSVCVRTGSASPLPLFPGAGMWWRRPGCRSPLA